VKISRHRLTLYDRQVREWECDNETVYILDLGRFVAHETLNMTFSYIWSLLGFVLPVLTLIYCNVHLVRALRESRRMRRRYVVNAARRVAPTSCCGSRVTPTLVAVVCMHLVLITPSELLQFFYYTVSRDAVEVFNTAVVVANVLVTANFAFNFVLYCVVDTRFREAWKTLVCGCRRPCRSRSRGGSFGGGQTSIRYYNASFARRHPAGQPCVYVDLKFAPSNAGERPSPRDQRPSTGRRSLTMMNSVP